MIKKIYNNKIIIGIIVILAVTFGGWLLFSNQITELSKEEKIAKEEVEKKLVLFIDYGEGDIKSFQSEFKEEMTVFDLLKSKTDELNIILKTKTYSSGLLIEAIGDKENGEGGKYWLYYVNGEMPMVAADRQQINPGDKIEFKFEKSPF